MLCESHHPPCPLAEQRCLVVEVEVATIPDVHHIDGTGDVQHRLVERHQDAFLTDDSGVVLQRIDEDVCRRSHSDVVSGRFGPLFHFENRSEFSQQDGPIASECASMLTGESRGIQ